MILPHWSPTEAPLEPHWSPIRVSIGIRMTSYEMRLQGLWECQKHTKYHTHADDCFWVFSDSCWTWKIKYQINRALIELMFTREINQLINEQINKSMDQSMVNGAKHQASVGWGRKECKREFCFTCLRLVYRTASRPGRRFNLGFLTW